MRVGPQVQALSRRPANPGSNLTGRSFLGGFNGCAPPSWAGGCYAVALEPDSKCPHASAKAHHDRHLDHTGRGSAGDDAAYPRLPVCGKERTKPANVSPGAFGSPGIELAGWPR